MKVTIIIPYKVDRGWLKDAVSSVPGDVQLILSKGEGNWPQNFNKALDQAQGDYIRYLHEDDMLTPNCIKDSLETFNLFGVDFIHGNAIDLYEETGKQIVWKPLHKIPSITDLLRKNVIHSATVMYKRQIFEKIGGFNEDPKMYSFEEFEFHLRCLKAGFKIGYCNSTLAYYRRHPRQIIRTVDKIERNKCRQELVNLYNK